MKSIFIQLVLLALISITASSCSDLNNLFSPDTQAPIIILNGKSTVEINQFENYIELGANATDEIDGVVNVDLSGMVNTEIAGTYIITYTAIDSRSNQSKKERTVIVNDITQPVITLIGNQEINLEFGQSYEELGAIVQDNYDKSVGYSVSGSVNETVLGSYLLTYHAVDTAQNHAVNVTRIVNIVDTTAPVITLYGESDVILEAGNAYHDQLASALDNKDGYVVVTVSGGLEYGKLGTQTILYSAQDASGNQSQIERTVTIVDTTAPVIEVEHQIGVRVNSGQYLGPEAIAIDAFQSLVSIQIEGEVDTNLIGDYPLIYRATDNSGNESKETVLVTVYDDIPPSQTLRGEPIIYLEYLQPYVEQGVTKLDNYDVLLDVEITGEVDSGQAGEYTIAYDVVDSSGNGAVTVFRTVIVEYGAFVSTWKTDNEGDSNDDQITLEANLEDFPNGYNFDVDWGDGQSDSGVTGNITHTYAVAGTYQVSITGDYPQIYFDSSNPTMSDGSKLLSVDQWGSNTWQSMKKAFYGTQNMVFNTLDIPNLSFVTDMNSMFYNAFNFNQDINDWDVSNVTDMGGMFGSTHLFNQNINNWDVSSVRNMNAMFAGAREFNQEIGSWDVSSVNNMSSLFSETGKFNQEIGDWDVSSVTNMNGMFAGSEAFNQEIGDWDVSSVNQMISMFANSISFNQPINTWDVSSVTNMVVMFNGSQGFQQSLEGWDVSSVTDMRYMFQYSTFNGEINNWRPLATTSLERVFFHAENFNQDISGWDVSSITNMEAMFDSALAFNQNLNDWDVSKVTNMSSMFFMAENFNQPLNDWDVSSVTDMNYLFWFAKVFNQDLNDWDVSNVTTMAQMFKNTDEFNGNISNWDVSKVTNFIAMFHSAFSFNQDISNWNLLSAEDLTQMLALAYEFNQDLSSWNISNVEDMYGLLAGVKLDTQYYDAMLIAWSNQMPKDGVEFHGGLSQYTPNSLAQIARTTLIDTYNWDLSDDGAVINPM